MHAMPRAVRGVTGSPKRAAPATTLVRGSKVLSMEDFWGPIRAVPAWKATVAITQTMKAKNTDSIQALNGIL